MSAEVSLRERTRRAVRAEIVDVAMELFLSRGFEATTVEEIARAAGLSRRSYFRYFVNKEEAFAEGLAAIGATIAKALSERPANEPPWDALRIAFESLVEHAGASPNAEAMARLMLERPDVQQGKDAAWLAEIASVLAARLAADEAAFQARALAAAAISCLHTAQEQWLEPGESRDLGRLLTLAMAAVRPLASAH